MNKVWQKPKLVILYRGRPEESVLYGCKTGTIVSKAFDPLDKNNDCWKAPGCGLCSFLDDS